MSKRHPPTDPWVRTSEPLFWMLGAGHEQITPSRGYFYDARKRTDTPHYVLQLTLAGAGFFEKNRRRHLVEPGTAFLHEIPGDFTYGYPPERNDTYDQVFVSMSGPVASRWCERIIAAHGHVLRFPAHAAGTVSAIMLDLVRRRAGDQQELRDRYLVSAQLDLLVMTVMSVLSHERLAVRPLVAQAVELIQHNAANPKFDVAAMAMALGCTREHLARSFRAATGVSPSDYLIQHRLRLATAALRERNEKIDAVARRSGFAGANYFCRIFRRHIGVTPGQFRQRPWLTAF